MALRPTITSGRTAGTKNRDARATQATRIESRGPEKTLAVSEIQETKKFQEF